MSGLNPQAGSEGVQPDLFAMSDDEIMSMGAPEDLPVLQGTGAEAPVEQQAEQPVIDQAASGGEAAAAPVESSDGAPALEVETQVAAADPLLGSQTGEAVSPADPAAQVAQGEAAPAAVAQAAPDYEGFYKQIMTPFKANGKMIELKDPAEAVQLMQMGANYTRKLQDLQPHRKVLLMLQNNDLLDEGKLSYLIDLDKKNPEAIKKLVKDAGIDPMEIDTGAEPAYLEGNHRVTDEEAAFHQQLDDLTSTQPGRETVQLINSQWDQASKEVLWKSPEIMSIIHAQRETGVYDLIVAELDRQRTFGKIPPNTPFLQAYKIVGDELTAAQAFNHLDGGTAPTNVAQPVVVATRAAPAPKSNVTNGDKASAASPTRSTPRKVEAIVNPLAMSDDEFLSQMANRL